MKLKPCPFCGEQVWIDNKRFRETTSLVHPENECVFFDLVMYVKKKDKKILSKLWNRRIT